ncbi:alpha/beta fold hydrolase [Rossellomorea sp. NS-SX7]|uniref:alpha/beta fold hydrolase n=1 Tax=Rossellomorea sp. NS-SX7 TaxID=3463856 RepID=UPI0040583D4B
MDNWKQTAITSLLFPASITTALLRRNEKQPPPGKLVHTERGTFHVIEKGKGPVTVLMDAGLSGQSLHWHRVQEILGSCTHTISFDRKGYGWSSRREYGDGLSTVRDMEAILAALGISSPLVLAGHSYGGLNVRLFASENRERVKGIVFVDAVVEERYLTDGFDSKRKKEWRNSLRMMKFGHYTAYTGLPRLLKMKVGGRYMFPELEKYHSFVGYSPKAYEAVFKELRDSGITAQQVTNSRPLDRSLPLTVIQSGNQSPEWTGYQEGLKALSDDVREIKTTHGHNVHMENPELVAEAILKHLSFT